METIIIENKAEKIARRQAIVEKAVRIRDITRFFGGWSMDVWEERNCPRFKRWLWRINNAAKRTIYNTNLEIGWLTYGNKLAKDLV